MYNERIYPFPLAVLIAGVVVSLLVVALLLLTLSALVVTVVVRVRRRKRGKREGGQERKADTTDSYYGFKDEVQNGHSAQNGRAPCPSISNTQSAQHLLHISEHYEVSSAFIEPASAANLLHDAVRRNDEDQGSADTGGEFERARGLPWGRGHHGEVERHNWGGGGLYEELPSEGHYEEPPSDMKRAGYNGASNSKAQAKKHIRNPELTYAQPDKSNAGKVKGKRGEGKCEEKRPVPAHMYAKPDMAKKMNKRQLKKEGEWGEKKQFPQTSLPDHKHQEYEGEVEEDAEAAPQLPPPYIPDEEHYYNTRSVAGLPNRERNYNYAMVGQMW